MMNMVRTDNGGTAFRFRNIFKPRDIFFHDGKSLRRVSVGVPLQVTAALAGLFLILWSAFAAAQIATAPTVDPVAVARMEMQVQAMHADVQMIKKVADTRYKLTVKEVRRLGLDPKRFAGTGGPFEAVQPLQSASNPKFKQLFMSWKKLDQIEQGTIAIPSTEPVKGMSFTSGYGVRSDPFRGRAAMHAGIDLAGPVGTNIYATADGIVGRSEYNRGGYGNLVELNHGRGIQTRYGHMSKLLVKAGQRVKRGDIIGLMGSTGRSTGSHLHYEVRIDGKAVNPVPFMQSNDYLLAVQRRAAAATRVAQGGPAGATQ
ncbi:M23 family metallopeptidase [Enterovirga sp. GCM10030262]|uniref:M23 family metallopeptidase n=1 Tax=Enterovirga sp. GCM10030262 TaxID=3273391 RepID=UPI003623325F